MTQLQKLQAIATAAITSGAEILGDLVWWSLSDARIGRSELLNIWGAAGLDIALIPPEPSGEKAIRTAVKDASVRLDGLIIRPVLHTPETISFAIVREVQGQNGVLSHSHEASVSYDRKGDRFAIDRIASTYSRTPEELAKVDTLCDVIRQGYDQLRHTHTIDDVRRAMVKACESYSAVSLRDTGGIYWIPACYGPQIRQLQTAVEQIGKSTVYLLPIHKTTDGNRALAACASGSIEAELGALAREIDAFVAEPPDRVSTLTKRLPVFEALRDRADLYRTILGVQVEDLDGRLASMSKAIESMIAAHA
jgi:hypothetical protein